MSVRIAERPAATKRSRPSLWPLLRAEWVKFRSVRGWLIGLVVAAIVTIFLGIFTSGNASIGCFSGPGGSGTQLTGKACLPYVPIGPGGEAVTDTFFFVHQPLAGNGSITARVDSLTGRYSNGNSPVASGPRGSGQPGANLAPGLVGWAKAGLMVKASTRQGAAYAAIMVTGSHGVRMQDDFTHDTPGLAGAVTVRSPRWLRLTRSGSTITGYDSADGRHWFLVGSAELAGLPTTVQSGVFATAPQYLKITPFFGGGHIQSGPSVATATFADLRLTGSWPSGRWTGTALGGGIRGDYPDAGGDWHHIASRLTVTGSGDIAPVVPGPGGGGFPTATFEQSLVGLFAGLIAIVVVSSLFVTSEYRRGLIRVTFAAAPRRGRLLAAKAMVAGLAAFATALVAAVVCVALALPRQRSEGLYVLPVPALTEARVLIGTAALAAIAAVFAVAVGAIVRRSAAAVTIGIVVIVLPFFLSAAVLPNAASDWLLRLTPAAGFAIEQSIPHYAQISTAYSAATGQYPLPPWAGLGVLAAYAAAALALATWLLRRRDV